MKTMRSVSLLAGLLALGVIGSASEVEGRWEGNWQGAKALTLTVRETQGRVEGNAVFYLIRREKPAEPGGAPSPEISLQNPRWDGATLRFSVKGSNGQPVLMEMKVTGPNTAELTREAGSSMPALTIPMHKQ